MMSTCIYQRSAAGATPVQETAKSCAHCSVGSSPSPGRQASAVSTCVKCSGCSKYQHGQSEVTDVSCVGTMPHGLRKFSNDALDLLH